MTPFALPKVEVPLLDFGVGGGRAISLVKVKNIELTLASPALINVCLSECFDAPEIRLGGVLSFPEGFPSAAKSKLLSYPFPLLNCVAVDSGVGLHSPNDIEMEALTRVFVDRKIRSKSGKLLDPRSLKAAPGVFVVDCCSPTISSKAELVTEDSLRIGVVRFVGQYRPGSQGAADAVLIGRVLNMFSAVADPDGMIVDMTELEYEYGDDLHVSTYKFHGSRSPIVVLAKSHQLDAFQGAGIRCLASDSSAALQSAVARAKAWAAAQ